MTSNDLQEPLQTLATMLDHVVAEPVREHFPRQGRDRDPRAFALQDVAEVFKVRVPSAHDRVLQFERGDVCSADDLVRGVHVAGCAMCLGITDLGTM